MKNTIIYLIGFPGTGKYTVAKEITGLTGAKLVDNHLINNPVFSVVKTDGASALPEAVWEKTRAIRCIVLDTISEMSPADFSFVFTNQLVEGDTDDAALFLDIVELAARRRIVSQDRKERFKDTDPESARHRLRTQKVLGVHHPHSLDLDVTELSAAQAVEKIVRHVQGVVG